MADTGWQSAALKGEIAVDELARIKARVARYKKRPDYPGIGWQCSRTNEGNKRCRCWKCFIDHYLLDKSNA